MVLADFILPRRHDFRSQPAAQKRERPVSASNAACVDRRGPGERPAHPRKKSTAYNPAKLARLNWPVDRNRYVFSSPKCLPPGCLHLARSDSCAGDLGGGGCGAGRGNEHCWAQRGRRPGRIAGPIAGEFGDGRDADRHDRFGQPDTSAARNRIGHSVWSTRWRSATRHSTG